MFKGGGVAKTGCSDVQVYKMKLHDLHFSTDIIRKIKSKIMRLVGYGARRGGGTEMRIVFWWLNLKERDSLKDEVVRGRILLK